MAARTVARCAWAPASLANGGLRALLGRPAPGGQRALGSRHRAAPPGQFPWRAPAAAGAQPPSAPSACRQGRRIACAAGAGKDGAGAGAEPELDQKEYAEALRIYEEFQETLRDPEEIWVRASEARRKFGLSREDLHGLTFITKESPYETDGVPFRQYHLPELVELALKKHGKAALLDQFWSKHLPAAERSRLKSISVYGNFPGSEEDKDLPGPADEVSPVNPQVVKKTYWYNAPSTSTVEGRQSIVQGLRTNVGICTVKSCVYVVTGSHVIFADLMHSIADVANYSYRLMELSRSSQHRDVRHPYGYAPLRYITADRSFVFLLFVGGVYPLVTGIGELFSTHVAVCEHVAAPAIVFLASGVLESKAMKAAYKEILSQAQKEQVAPAARWPGDLGRVVGYLRDGRDVMSTATFTEASSGVLGASVGLAGLGASWYLHSAVPDVGCSIIMASMVCAVSTFLMRKSGNALLGQTLPSWRVQALVSRLEQHPSVVNVYDVKTEMVGTDTVRFKAEVQFHPTAVTERMLQEALSGASGPSAPGTDAKLAAQRAAYRELSARLQSTLPMLKVVAEQAAQKPEAQGCTAAVSHWLCKNNDLFYEALVWELKDVERVLRKELRDFRNVHIDLEPW